MSVAFLADCHLYNHRAYGGQKVAGVNTRAQEILDALTTAVKIAERESQALVILGDFFDGVRPEPQLVAAAAEALRSDRITVNILVGNHDQVSDRKGDHALGPLAEVHNVFVYEKPTTLVVGGLTLAMVPFQSGDAKQWLPGVLKKMKLPPGSALCVHLGLAVDDTPPWLKSAHDAIHVKILEKLAHKHKFSAVFAGNWHSQYVKRSAGLVMVQTGALVPTGFDNPGVDGYGGLVLWRGADEIALREITGPRYVKTTSYEEIEQLAREVSDSSAYQLRIRWTVPADELAGARDAADELVEQEPAIDAIEVRADTSEVELAARSAAVAARSQSNLDDALGQYTARMALPEGVDRDEVHARCKNYLSGGA